MYCRKCGKEIDYDAEYCKECQREEYVFGEGAAPAAEETSTVAQQPQQDTPNTRMYGFTMALIAAILAFVALSISRAGVVGTLSLFLPAAKVNVGVVAIVMQIVAFLTAAPAVVFGILSVHRFRYVSSQNAPKPVATLVLGIAALAFVALTVLNCVGAVLAIVLNI